MASTSAGRPFPGRHSRYAKMAIRSGGDKVNRTIRTLNGDLLELECVLNNADLTSLTPESIRGTFKRLRKQTKNLPQGRPQPTIVKTLEDCQFTCFSDHEDFVNFCKYDVQESLKQLLASNTASDALNDAHGSRARVNRASTGENSYPIEQPTVSNHDTSTEHTLTSVRRRKRKMTQAAVPFREQFTYSMDFLDDEDFGVRYVDEEYYDDEAYIPQHDTGSRGGKRQKRGQSAATTSSAQVNNIDSTQLLQQQQQNHNSTDSLESHSNRTILSAKRRFKKAATDNRSVQRTSSAVSGSNQGHQLKQQREKLIKSEDEQVENELEECYSDEDESGHHGLLDELEKRSVEIHRVDFKGRLYPQKAKPKPTAPATLTAAQIAASFAPFQTSEEEDFKYFENVEEPTVETMDDQMRFEGLVPSIFFSSRGRPDFDTNLDTFLRYQEKLYKSVMADRVRISRDSERARLHNLVTKPDMSILKELRKLLVPARTPAPIGNRVIRLTDTQFVVDQQKSEYHRNLHLEEEERERRVNQIRFGQWTAPNGQQQQVRVVNGGVHQFHQQQPQQRFSAPQFGSSAVARHRTITGQHNSMAANQQMRIRLPAQQTAVRVVNGVGAPRVFNSGTMRVQQVRAQSQPTAFMRNGQLVQVATNVNQQKPPGSFTLAGGNVILSNYRSAKQRQQQQQQPQQQQQVPLKTYTIAGRAQTGASPAAGPSSSPQIYVINPAGAATGGAGSLSLKPTGNVVNIANKPLTNFLTIAPRPAASAQASGTSTSSAVTTTTAAAAGAPTAQKITVQIVRGPGGGSASFTTQSMQLINGQNVRLLSLPASIAGGGGVVAASGQKQSLLAVRPALSTAGVAVASTTATAATGGGAGSTASQAPKVTNHMVQVPITVAMGLWAKSNPQGTILYNSIATANHNQKDNENQQLSIQPQQQQVRTITLRAPISSVTAAGGGGGAGRGTIQATPNATSSATFVSRSGSSSTINSTDPPGTFRVPVVPRATSTVVSPGRQTLVTLNNINATQGKGVVLQQPQQPQQPQQQQQLAKAAIAVASSPGQPPRKVTIITTADGNPIGVLPSGSPQLAATAAAVTASPGASNQGFLDAERMKQMLAEQQQQNPNQKNARFVLRSPTPVIDVGRTVSVQTTTANSTPATTVQLTETPEPPHSLIDSDEEYADVKKRKFKSEEEEAPLLVESAYTESELAESEFSGDESMKSDPMENEPMDNEPMDNEPVKSDPIENEPVDNNVPMKNVPMKSDPIEETVEVSSTVVADQAAVAVDGN